MSHDREALKTHYHHHHSRSELKTDSISTERHSPKPLQRTVGLFQIQRDNSKLSRVLLHRITYFNFNDFRDGQYLRA